MIVHHFKSYAAEILLNGLVSLSFLRLSMINFEDIKMGSLVRLHGFGSILVVLK